MNDAIGVVTDALLTTADLAAWSDFTLGLTVVSPSTRTIAGPGGTADVEPRVMQVLLALAERAGQVVTRDTLFRRCWGGVYAGDDSLNHSIAAVRKLASGIGGGSFQIETVPRTGYRLTGAAPRFIEDSAGPGSGRTDSHLSRRLIVGGGLATAAVAMTGLWSLARIRADRRTDDLLDRAARAVADGSAFNDDRTQTSLQELLADHPQNARAWGLLALIRIYRTQWNPDDLAAAVPGAREAANRALAIDAREPNALLAMYELQGAGVDWLSRDRQLRQIIAVDPRNVLAIQELAVLLQATGLNRESWNWNERALALEPTSSDFLGKRALKLWIAGRVSEADGVADRLLDMYPADPWSYWIRFLIYALTNRAKAARALMESYMDKFMAPTVNLWLACLPALDEPSPAAVAKARSACFGASTTAAEMAPHSVMILSALGQVDAAFEVANGFLLSRGPIVRRGKSKVGTDSGWRINTQWLFTPACAAMRSDSRFLQLCNDTGLVDYWKRRGVRPDYLEARR